MRVLVLDDDLLRIKEFEARCAENKLELTTITTADACIRLLKLALEYKENRYNLIFLDHDLGGQIFVDVNRTNTGSEVARWIAENPNSIRDSAVFVHSFNPVGAKRMTDLIVSSKYVPAAWTKSNFSLILQYAKGVK